MSRRPEGSPSADEQLPPIPSSARPRLRDDGDAKPAFNASLRLENMDRTGDLAQAPQAMTMLEQELKRLESALADLQSGALYDDAI